MKKIIIISIGILLISFSSFAQTFEMRTFLDEQDYISVQLRQTNIGVQPNTLSNADNDGITNMTFTLRWPQSLVDVDVDLICSRYNIIESGTRQTNGIYYYQQFGASLAFYSPDDFVLNHWVTIATIQTSISSGSNSGTFELAPNGWEGSLLVTIDWNDAGSSTEYNPAVITGDCDNTPIPTIVYDYVWTGAISSLWDATGNWETECGSAVGSLPTIDDNCIIPSGVSHYPNEYQAQAFNGVFACNNFRINSGASVTLDELDLLIAQVTYNVSGKLLLYGTLNIAPNTQITVQNSTYLDAAEGLVIQADENGVGSFIDNGTITYGTGGTAKVQTFLSNETDDNFDIHLVGPTVDEASYTGGGTGAFLSAFAINASTYAYEYNDGWLNINSNTFEVITANGIGLSTIDNDNHTLEMTGALMTGDQSSPTLAHDAASGANNWELISNPYPSSIDFDILRALNSNVNNKFSLWDPFAGNWVEYAGGAGADKFIQVGQGFFVETNVGGTFDFTNTGRAHSNNAFRETMANILTVTATGGMEGYRDVAIVRFDANATNGYDINMEAKFWESQNSDATSLRSVTEDNLELAINVLPTESLSGEMLSVPLKFDCGYSTDYTLSFTDIESFEMGTEIYLEDLKTGEDWIYINDNPIYTFNATSNQSSDRFIVHFFGPTGMEEISEESIDIYSSGQNAYVRNNTNENIKMIYVYNLSGELIMSTKSDNQKVSKLRVSDKIGYYVVRVITDTNTYTKKVLIFN